MSIVDVVEGVVARIQDDLNSQAESLLGELESTRSELEGIMEELDGEWEALSSRAEGLISRAEETQAKITELGGQLVARAQESRTHVDSVVEKGNSVFDSARSVVETMDQGLAALIPSADEIAAEAGRTVDTLRDEMGSLDEALEATRSITDEHLRNPFNSLIDDLQNQLGTRADQARSYVQDDLLVTMADEKDRFMAHVDDVVASADQKLSEMQATAERDGADAMSQVQSMFGDQFGALIDTAQTLANVIDQVGTAIEGTSEVVGTTTKVMGQGVSMTAIGAKSAIGIVEDIIEIFESVS